ncbi:MAG: hypothetical protein GOV02_04115 [Candidatus Aenigmarchaeota archaeon]|nr:hypothetical protein [Candidatus Aenigmarchaeota archaeon]
MVSSLIKTKADLDKLPASWYSGVEKSREKARKLNNKVVAVDQTTSVVVGRLIAIDIDKLWNFKYPYCKLTLRNPQRYRSNGNFECKMSEIELFFVNKPKMLLDLEELSDRHPIIYRAIRKQIKICP